MVSKEEKTAVKIISMVRNKDNKHTDWCEVRLITEISNLIKKDFWYFPHKKREKNWEIKLRDALENWVDFNKGKKLHLIDVSKLLQIITQYFEVVEN